MCYVVVEGNGTIVVWYHTDNINNGRVRRLLSSRFLQSYFPNNEQFVVYMMQPQTKGEQLFSIQSFDTSELLQRQYIHNMAIRK